MQLREPPEAIAVKNFSPKLGGINCAVVFWRLLFYVYMTCGDSLVEELSPV